MSRNDRRPLLSDTPRTPFSPTCDSPLISPSPQSFTPTYRSSSPIGQNRFNQNRFTFNARPPFNTQKSSGGPGKPFILHVKGSTDGATESVTEEYIKSTFQNNADSVNVVSVEIKKT